jgi:hypothetical protein
MDFLSDSRELELIVRKVTAKAGKDDQRFVKIEFACQIYDGLASVLPKWMQRGYATAREVASGCVSVGFDRKVESQNVSFRQLPKKNSKDVVFDFEAIDLTDFEIERVEGTLWLRFSVSTVMAKNLWDFLWRFYARAVWAEITECQAELPVAADKSKGAERLQ